MSHGEVSRRRSRSGRVIGAVRGPHRVHRERVSEGRACVRGRGVRRARVGVVDVSGVLAGVRGADLVGLVRHGVHALLLDLHEG